MAYTGAEPLPIQAGGTNATSLAAGILTTDGTTVMGNSLDQYAALIGGSGNTVASVDPSSTAGYALCSNGSSSNPSFQAVPGSSLVWLGSQTANNSDSLQFASLIASPYTIYKVIFYSVYPTNDGDDIWCQISSDNGSIWQTTGYLSGTNRAPTNSATITNANITTGFLICSTTTSSTSLVGACGTVDFYNFLGVNLPCYTCRTFNQVTGSSTGRSATGGGVYASTFSCNAIQFVCSTGTIASGTVALFGIKESS